MNAELISLHFCGNDVLDFPELKNAVFRNLYTGCFVIGAK